MAKAGRQVEQHGENGENGVMAARGMASGNNGRKNQAGVIIENQRTMATLFTQRNVPAFMMCRCGACAAPSLPFSMPRAARVWRMRIYRLCMTQRNARLPLRNVTHGVLPATCDFGCCRLLTSGGGCSCLRVPAGAAGSDARRRYGRRGRTRLSSALAYHLYGCARTHRAAR